MVSSSIGRKAILAVTGLALVGFVIAHMLGNLQVFLGPDALNAYAHKLKSMPVLLWTMRFGLLVVFVTHISLAVQLTRENALARPIPYAFQATRQASIESMTMIYSGLVIFVFVLYHLAHYTFMTTDPSFRTMTRPLHGEMVPDVYGMVIKGFRAWPISVVYVLAQIVLGLHICHGASSIFQTLGLNNEKYRPAISKIGPILATVIVLGNISMPLAILFRMVGS